MKLTVSIASAQWTSFDLIATYSKKCLMSSLKKFLGYILIRKKKYKSDNKTKQY